MKESLILVNDNDAISGIPESENDFDKARLDPGQFLLRDIMIEIFKYLSMKDLSSISLVCKTWLRISSDDRIWSSVVSMENRKLKQHEFDGILKEGKDVRGKYILSKMHMKKSSFENFHKWTSVPFVSFIPSFPKSVITPSQESIDEGNKRIEAYKKEIEEMELSLNLSIK
ncbi:MAG: F-box protein [Gammaproteobacteria bacterium]|nr:F-box protein [Gammaproteobacteria bacterium]